MDDTTSILAQIASGADQLRRLYEDADIRYTNSADAGAKLAAEVYRFIQDPEAVGTEALNRAYKTYIDQHAGNFCNPYEPGRPEGVGGRMNVSGKKNERAS